MSLVEVLPVEPVMPTNRARLRARSSRPIAASAANSSVGHERRRAAVARIGDELASAADGDEEVAGPNAARVDLEAGDLARAVQLTEAERLELLGPAIGIMRAQRLARDDAVVERELHAADLLALLVPLPRDHDDVARLGEPDRAPDRRAPVGLDLDVRAGALEDLLDDRQRILAARVVGGDDDDVGEVACERPSAAACRGRGRRRSRRRRSRGRSASSRAVRSTFSSASGLWA